jgi:cytochrome c biogenesis protein CcmG/thiol:disulfide interchange protein DsbE
MNMRWGALLPLLVLLLLAAALWRGLGRDPTFVPSPLIGLPVPAFDLPSLTDPTRRVTDQDLRGQVTLVNIWGTWCAGCRKEHDILLALARDGVRIIGIDWKDDPDAARAWLRQLGDPYAAVAVDAEGRVAIDWGAYGAPETFVVDAAGRVRDKHVGALTAEVVATRIAPLIAALQQEAAR